eukprot:1368136-Rhodomonas_salina.1
MHIWRRQLEARAHFELEARAHLEGETKMKGENGPDSFAAEKLPDSFLSLREEASSHFGLEPYLSGIIGVWLIRRRELILRRVHIRVVLLIWWGSKDLCCGALARDLDFLLCLTGHNKGTALHSNGQFHSHLLHEMLPILRSGCRSVCPTARTTAVWQAGGILCGNRWLDPNSSETAS